MAVTISNLGASTGTTPAAPDIREVGDATSYQIASWDPPNDGIVVLCIFSGENAGNLGIASVTGNGNVWEEIDVLEYVGGTPTRGLYVYAARGEDLTTGITTIDLSPNTAIFCYVSIFHVQGADEAQAALQDTFTAQPTVSGSGTGTGTGTVDFQAPASAGNRALIFVGHNANEAITNDGGYTALDDMNGAGPAVGMLTTWDADGVSDASFTWTTSANWGYLGFEIRESATFSTFGRTTPGTSLVQVSADFNQVSAFPLSETALVQSLSIYLDGNGAGVGNQVLRAVIYEGTGATPAGGARKAVSNEVTITDGQAAGFVTFPLPAPVELPARLYWLGFIAGATHQTARFYARSATANRKWNAETYSATPADPFGTVDGSDGEEIPIYASYEPTPSFTRVPRRSAKALFGPAINDGNPQVFYTVPAGIRTLVRFVHVSNAGGAEEEFRLAVGDPDVDANRILNWVGGGNGIPANSYRNRTLSIWLNPGETLQGYTAGSLSTIRIDGYERPAG